jgi:hypothetical protein
LSSSPCAEALRSAVAATALPARRLFLTAAERLPRFADLAKSIGFGRTALW